MCFMVHSPMQAAGIFYNVASSLMSCYAHLRVGHRLDFIKEQTYQLVPGWVFGSQVKKALNDCLLLSGAIAKHMTQHAAPRFRLAKSTWTLDHQIHTACEICHMNQ